MPAPWYNVQPAAASACLFPAVHHASCSSSAQREVASSQTDLQRHAWQYMAVQATTAVLHAC